MKKRFLTLILALALCVPMTGCKAEGSAGIFYRVTGGKNEMTLLGSIHIGSEAMYPLSSQITDALAAADVLVFECDSESEDTLVAALTMMTYPIGETLKDHISEDCYALLEQASEKINSPASAFQAIKPWAVASTFSLQASAAQMGVEDIQASLGLGVENQIRALADGKPEAYLEDAQEQYDILDGFSPELQEYMLEQSLLEYLDPANATGADAYMSEWPGWWHDGNADAFAATYLEGMETDAKPELTEEYHQKLVTERNQRMALGLQALLEGEEERSYFVTVGLLHLVLPGDSVIAELEKLGYTVEQVLPL